MAACWAALSFLDPRVLTVTALLSGSLLAGALIIAMVDRWRKRQTNFAQPHEQLASFRVLYERGEMSEEEYQRVRARLTPKLKPTPAAPSPTGAAPESRPENPPAAPPPPPDTRSEPSV